MNGIKSDSGGRYACNLANRDFPARRSIAAVVNPPGADPSTQGSGDNPAFRRVRLDLADPSEGRIRSLDDGFRFGIPAGGAIENKQSPAAARTFAVGIAAASFAAGTPYNQEVIHGIDTNERMSSAGTSNLSVGTRQKSNWRSGPPPFPRKDPDSLPRHPHDD